MTKDVKLVPRADVDEFTAYIEHNPSSSNSPLSAAEYALADTLNVDGLGGAHYTGRGLICHSYDRKYLSVTMRPTRKVDTAEGNLIHPDVSRLPFNQEPTTADETANEEFSKKMGYFPQRYPFKDLVSCYDISKLLYRLALKRQAKASQGLVLFAGPTKTNKSVLARGMIYFYLKQRLRDQKPDARFSHLLTVENPIENHFYYGNDGSYALPEETQSVFGLDYTPRLLGPGRDTPTLRHALMEDALRQTPAVVYVGECRNDEEIRTVVEFAQTGHLILTTIHANSLVDALKRVFTSVGAKTPADHGDIVERILAVIHLQRIRVDVNTRPNALRREAVIPALWRNTPKGISGMTADGLASILPNAPNDPRDFSVLGRLWFTRKLLRKASPAEKQAFEQQATDFDLRGV